MLNSNFHKSIYLDGNNNIYNNRVEDFSQIAKSLISIIHKNRKKKKLNLVQIYIDFVKFHNLPNLL